MPLLKFYLFNQKLIWIKDSFSLNSSYNTSFNKDIQTSFFLKKKKKIEPQDIQTNNIYIYIYTK